MSKIRRVLQLLHEAGLSQREVARVTGVSKSSVAEIASYARAAGLRWEQARTLDDEALRARMYPPTAPRSARHLEPEWAQVHQQPKLAGVTLQPLWEEYRQSHGEQAYKYSAFCEKYARWARHLKRSMRQVHKAGERLFVDYAGQTVPIVDALTGEIRRAQVFVAVLGASNYTYACATERQTTADWIGAQVLALSAEEYAFDGFWKGTEEGGQTLHHLGANRYAALARSYSPHWRHRPWWCTGWSTAAPGSADPPWSRGRSWPS